MIPSAIRRGPQGRPDVPVWLVAVGAITLIIVAFLLYVLFTMGSGPGVSEVTADLPVQF